MIKKKKLDKEYYDVNIDKIKEYNKKYHQANIEKTSEKFICECGCEVMKRHKTPHLKTKKHIKLIEQLQNVLIV